MEELGLVPSQLVNVLLLYAKPMGGFRPIGLLPSIIRLWEYCRKQVLWDWEKDNWRESNWAAPGRSSFTVVAHQRLAAEGAPDGHETAVALMDLVKAYELVPHHRIFDGAIKFGFPIRVLRVVFAVFLLARRICVDGCFSSSDILVPFSTIIAGSVFGPCFLRMSLQGTIDAWQANWPLLQLYLYIDDMGILCQGPRKYIEVVFLRR